MSRKRKIPLRKCIVTEEMKPKGEMIRVVRNKEGDIFVDPTGKLNGRGAYLTIDRAVFNEAREKRILDSVFNTTVDDKVYDELDQLVGE